MSTATRKYDYDSDLSVERRIGGLPRPYTDPVVLEELYVGQGLSTYEIGDRLGCSYETVRRWLATFGIGRRGRGA